MSAKKKRRKIIVNSNQKTGHCGPDCDKNNFKNLGAPKEVFINRLATPTLIDIDLSPKDRLAELGQEAQFEVFTTGLCHATSFDAVLFEHEQMIVVEGSAMATQSKSALVELISYCEDELEMQNFVIAVPKKRHDHRIFVNRLTNFLDFELMMPLIGWSEDFIFVTLEL